MNLAEQKLAQIGQARRELDEAEADYDRAKESLESTTEWDIFTGAKEVRKAAKEHLEALVAGTRDMIQPGLPLDAQGAEHNVTLDAKDAAEIPASIRVAGRGADGTFQTVDMSRVVVARDY